MTTTFRTATEADTALILQFIRALADYEHVLDQVVATEDLLREFLFRQQRAEVVFALENGAEVGFALYFYNFPAFLGRPGLYIEDLFVKPEFRGHGYGKALLQKLAQTAVERGCGRLEWNCMNWNRPSIEFYRSMGARPLNDRTYYRIDGETLTNLAAQLR